MLVMGALGFPGDSAVKNPPARADDTGSIAGWTRSPGSSPLLMATGGSIPLLCLEGVPRLPGEPQDEASLTREFET